MKFQTDFLISDKLDRVIPYIFKFRGKLYKKPTELYLEGIYTECKEVFPCQETITFYKTQEQISDDWIHTRALFNLGFKNEYLNEFKKGIVHLSPFYGGYWRLWVGLNGDKIQVKTMTEVKLFLAACKIGD
jgi:hypothetical protein